MRDAGTGGGADRKYRRRLAIDDVPFYMLDLTVVRPATIIAKRLALAAGPEFTGG
jgi:hypothetical protein